MSENLFNKQRLTFVTVLYIYIYVFVFVRLCTLQIISNYMIPLLGCRILYMRTS